MDAHIHSYSRFSRCECMDWIILDLHHFHQYIVFSLRLDSETSYQKRGRPCLKKFNPARNTLPKRPLLEIIPQIGVCLDNISHLPIMDSNKFASRYKRPGCTRRFRVICNKCKILLCLTTQKSCFFLIFIHNTARKVSKYTYIFERLMVSYTLSHIHLFTLCTVQKSETT